MDSSEKKDGTVYLLASDLDGTLIPPRALREDLPGVAAFGRAVRARPDIGLAYVTGRHFSLAMEGIHETGLPEPSLLSCDVGTSLYVRTEQGWTPDPEYRDLMREALGGVDAEDIRAALARSELLSLQEPAKQAEFKVSYYFAGEADRSELLASARGALESSGIRAALTASYDPEDGRGLLDVLPPDIAKDYAVRHLHELSGVDGEHVVYAGDSGNDTAAMLAGYRVIVVGNAPGDLKDHLRREGLQAGLAEHIFFARASFGDGVLEGLRHFGVL